MIMSRSTTTFSGLKDDPKQGQSASSAHYNNTRERIIIYKKV